jgi:hypothetical protein
VLLFPTLALIDSPLSFSAGKAASSRKGRKGADTAKSIRTTEEPNEAGEVLVETSGSLGKRSEPDDSEEKLDDAPARKRRKTRYIWVSQLLP